VLCQSRPRRLGNNGRVHCEGTNEAQDRSPRALSHRVSGLCCSCSGMTSRLEFGILSWPASPLASLPPELDVPLPLREELPVVVPEFDAVDGFAELAAGSPVTEPRLAASFLQVHKAFGTHRASQELPEAELPPIRAVSPYRTWPSQSLRRLFFGLGGYRMLRSRTKQS
jgi:hypothetical protein